VNSAAGEREHLVAMLAALEEPVRAAALSPDDPSVIAVARHHRLTPLLSITCGATLPAPLAEMFRRDRLVTGARNLLFSQVAEEVLSELTTAGVPTIILKGLDYETRLYGGAAARPTADIDLLVPSPKRRAAFAVLDRLGFEPRAAAPGFDDADYHEVAWTRAGIEIDLHMGLAPLARCRIDYGAIWREAETRRLGAAETRALARPHAAVFQALHMAIDHFDVPAIYLVDLVRLLPTADDAAAALTVARSWRCRRPLETALALIAVFLPGAAPIAPTDQRPSHATRRVTVSYGPTDELPRAEQLLRKLLHFDSPSDAVWYVAIQSRRNLREVFERRFRRRTARERLALVK
jgi:hypothetical protein